MAAVMVISQLTRYYRPCGHVTMSDVCLPARSQQQSDDESWIVRRRHAGHRPKLRITGSSQALAARHGPQRSLTGSLPLGGSNHLMYQAWMLVWACVLVRAAPSTISKTSLIACLVRCSGQHGATDCCSLLLALCTAAASTEQATAAPKHDQARS
jgi:hypothetical protein